MHELTTLPYPAPLHDAFPINVSIGTPILTGPKVPSRTSFRHPRGALPADGSKDSAFRGTVALWCTQVVRWTSEELGPEGKGAP
ncbi:hypothetical protein GCM10027262_55790 [Nocardia tengchongensis]